MLGFGRFGGIGGLVLLGVLAARTNVGAAEAPIEFCAELFSLSSQTSVFQAYDRMLRAQTSDMVGLEDLELMLKENDPFALQPDGPSHREHLRKLLGQLRSWVGAQKDRAEVERELLERARLRLTELARAGSRRSAVREIRAGGVITPPQALLYQMPEEKTSWWGIDVLLTPDGVRVVEFPGNRHHEPIEERGKGKLMGWDMGTVALATAAGAQLVPASSRAILPEVPSSFGIQQASRSLVTGSGTTIGARVWNAQTGEVFARAPELTEQGIRAIAPSETFAVLEQSKKIQTWNFNTGEVVTLRTRQEGDTPGMAMLSRVQVAADEKSFVAVYNSGLVERRAVDDGRVLEELPVQNELGGIPVTSAISWDTRLVARARGGFVTVHDLATGELLMQYKALEAVGDDARDAVTLTFSPDSRFLVAALDSEIKTPALTASGQWRHWTSKRPIPSTLVLIDVETAAELARFSNPGQASELQFDRSGRYLTAEFYDRGVGPLVRAYDLGAVLGK